ncbi:hypothetical protein [Paenibacillus cineris]|uniref:Uncharacterized protein n=1 Tax=Paenibacillus cineris TaxID=237530 RepID=A0ABQ4L7D3_9BACL|nr:hypothetical protein [Paenibacillus cineris]GIO52185.1 hypothetical protein J21TS7_05030 [Paenibacillus cineris]
METTVCPWCQTEIVWDEELGPEDECPYCHNELKGYRTLSIQLGADEEETDVDEEHEGIEGTDWELPEDDDKAVPFWNQEDMQQLPPSIRTLDKYEDSHDLMNYEETVEQILDEQEEVPECPKCRDYMVLAGTHQVGEQFKPAAFGVLQGPVLTPPFQVQMYICTGCFHVEYNLAEEDRLRMVDHLSQEKKNS